MIAGPFYRYHRIHFISEMVERLRNFTFNEDVTVYMSELQPTLFVLYAFSL